jgi:ribulose-bisphosphate carboxylase large chain
MSGCIRARYLLETGVEPTRAAEVVAGEQSSGTFVAVPGETDEIRTRFRARVERLEVVEEVDRPSLPGAAPAKDGIWRRCLVELSWPPDNFGPSLPNLLATLAGNLFELREVSGLRLLDLDLPTVFAERYPGPQFGIEGTRRLAGVHDRPLVGSIVKPSVGLSPEATAELVDVLCRAGIDFIKDDELQADGPHCPFEARARAVLAVIERHADRLGRKPMYALNLTGEIDEMRRRHDLVLALGGSCVMASLNSVGLTGFLELRRHSRLPIHAHRNGWGYLSRHPLLGWDYRAWSKIWRLAGADHMHVNGLANKFCESDGSVIASARSLLEPLFPHAPMRVMPVFSSGQTVRQAAPTFEALGTTDLIFAAGGGIMAHPSGPEAGVRALREAWEAAVQGIPAEVYARTHRALREALEAFR